MRKTLHTKLRGYRGSLTSQPSPADSTCSSRLPTQLQCLGVLFHLRIILKKKITTKSTVYDTAMSTHKVPCSPTPGVPTLPQESQGLKVGPKPEKKAWQLGRKRCCLASVDHSLGHSRCSCSCELGCKLQIFLTEPIENVTELVSVDIPNKLSNMAHLGRMET